MTIVGLGGSLRRGSTSLSALERALAGAETAGADTALLDLRDLDLPMFDP
jgi:NAD(P)H-dependent FMN reductase